MQLLFHYLYLRTVLADFVVFVVENEWDDFSLEAICCVGERSTSNRFVTNNLYAVF